MGVHYDTFPLIKIDHAAAKEKFRSKGLTLHLLPFGGTQDFYAPACRAFDETTPVFPLL
jgi:hypothetical protein